MANLFYYPALPAFFYILVVEVFLILKSMKAKQFLEKLEHMGLLNLGAS
jgi:hypothetical protein